MNNDLIRVENLSRQFIDGYGNKLNVIDNLNFTIKAGNKYSLLGKSGSGKSTLLHLIGGLDKPNSGSIFFLNKKLAAYSKNEISNWRNQHLGFVFQFHHLLLDFNALENVAIAQIIGGLKLKEAEKNAKKLLSELGLSKRLTHKVTHLSGGEKQRVAIARALINKPKLILADEPTGNLDAQTSEQVSDLLLNLCDQYQAALFVATHSDILAQKLGNTFQLEKGQLNTI